MEGCTLGQVLHGSATTTEAIRRAIQRSQESLRTVAKRHGINPKTVAKWRKRSFVADLPTGPKQPSSTVLWIEEEAIASRACRMLSESAEKRTFKAYPIGYFHIDIAEVRTAEGKLLCSSR